MENLTEFLGAHPFFKGLQPAHLNLLAGCTREVDFAEGQYIQREGEPANTFYLVQQGQVVVEASSPPLGVLGILTVAPGEIFGFHWLFPPYQWAFDYRASEATQALEVDGRCMRGECEQDHELGYQLMWRFAEVLSKTLNATRYQLLDTIHECRTD